MITDRCQLTRHTFYNHFEDVYDLLASMFEHEVIDDLEKCCNLQRWKHGVTLVLQYTLDHKKICLNTYRSLGREHLDYFLYKIFKDILMGLLKSLPDSDCLDQPFLDDVSDFFSYAIVGQFLAWLNTGLKEPPQAIANRIFRMLDGTILRLVKNHLAEHKITQITQFV